MKTIAVCGATGRQGGAVIRHLLRSGNFRIRALTRNIYSEQSTKLKSQGVEVVYAHLDESPTLVKALEDTDIVFSVQNYWENGVGFKGVLSEHP